MKQVFKIALLAALLIPLGDATACMVAKPGFDWGAEELVGKSNSIVLAVLDSVETENTFETKFRLRTVTVLKGDGPEFIDFYSGSRQHYGEHFAGHTSREFWTKGVGRSAFPCCICGPDHTFVEGETYLLFPDAFGAMKSAEIVSGPDDKWLEYVKESIK